MTIQELRQKLAENKIPDRWYSLDEGLKPDALILQKIYFKWEYFYLDEKGGRHDAKTFFNEEAAYDHLWQKIEDQLKAFRQNKD